MRAGFGQFNVPTDEYLQYAAQFGATDVLLNTPQLPGGERWELYDLVKLRVRVESFGLKLTALENVPTRFYDHIMLNGSKRDEQIENMIETVRNIARAGIPIFGYSHVPRNIVPRLRQAGVSEAAIQQMLVENPRRLLPLTR